MAFDYPANDLFMQSSDSGYYKLILDILNFMFEDKNLAARIDHILGMIGTFLDVSRAYVFEDDFERGISTNTYEWCSDGAEPLKDALQAVPHDPIAEWYEILQRDGILVTDNVFLLPKGVSRLLEAQGVRAIAVLPLLVDGEQIGFIGVDECRGERVWSEREIEVLRALSTLVSTLISRDRMEALLQASHRRFRTVMDNIEIPVYVSDLETDKILFANKKFLMEMKRKSAEGECCWQVKNRRPEGRCRDCPRERLAELPEGTVYNWERYNARQGKWYYCTDSLIEWVDGRRAHLQSAVEITARKQYEERLVFSASRDAMTGIYNRETGLRMARELIEAGRREDLISTFCYVDLDNLKLVNDTYGHSEGDRMIFTMVEAISGVVRNTDTFARLGGDEFMVAFRSCNIPNAKRVIANVNRKLEQTNLSGKFPYTLSFSVGYAEILPGKPCDVDSILVEADKNMYANKQAKKDD